MILVLGEPGRIGPAGLPGDNGSQGFAGLQGSAGRDGPSGASGARGDRGVAGSDGAEGPRGIDGYAEGYIIVRHSQDFTVPFCPSGYNKMWEGYSLLYTVGNGHSHGQDLGDAGSCVRQFRYETCLSSFM